MCQLFLRACSPALRCRRRRRKERKPEEEVSFLSRSSKRVADGGCFFFKSMLFFGLFFWSFLLRSCTFVDDERELKRRLFVVSIYSFLFIYFFIVLSPQITQKEKIALVLISLHFFYARRRRRRRAFFLLGEWMLIEDGGEFSNEFRRRRRRRRSRNKNDDEEKFPNRHAIFNQSKRREKLLRGKIPMVGLALTFLSYTMYHATRKPPSIVKSVLNPDSTQRELGRDGWEPFSGPDGNSLLGSIDVSFLSGIFHRNVLFRPHWRFDGFEEIFNHWDGWVWTVRLHVWYGIFLRHSLNVLFCVTVQIMARCFNQPDGRRLCLWLGIGLGRAKEV